MALIVIVIVVVGVGVYQAFTDGEDLGKPWFKPGSKEANEETDTTSTNNSKDSAATKRKDTSSGIALYEREGDEPIVTILSAVDDTKWIKVNCGEKTFKGEDKVISP